MLGGCMQVTKNLRHVFIESSFKIVLRTACLSCTLWQFTLKIMKAWISCVYICEKFYIYRYIFSHIYMNGPTASKESTGLWVYNRMTGMVLETRVFTLFLSLNFCISLICMNIEKTLEAFGRYSYSRPC